MKGEFKVQPLTDYPERFYSMKKLFLFRGEDFITSVSIINLRALEGKDLFIVECKEFTDSNAAKSAVGCLIRIPKEERVALREGEYWIDDLIGMSVIEIESGSVLGKVKDVIRNGGNELYLIDGFDGKEHLIPAVGEFIKNIDERACSIYIALIDGLW
ncbi:MAG: ribosome maturation factor RimM [Synergistaceae bacterium]|nr:ribosome maturation factor RimM [Synergistaceae bacterium]